MTAASCALWPQWYQTWGCTHLWKWTLHCWSWILQTHERQQTRLRAVRIVAAANVSQRELPTAPDSKGTERRTLRRQPSGWKRSARWTTKKPRVCWYSGAQPKDTEGPVFDRSCNKKGFPRIFGNRHLQSCRNRTAPLTAFCSRSCGEAGRMKKREKK